MKIDFEQVHYFGNLETDSDDGDACAVYIFPCSHDLQEFSILGLSNIAGFSPLFMSDHTKCA